MRQTLAALSVLLLTSLSCSPTASALVLQQPGAPVTGSPIEHELTQLDHHQQQQHAGSAGSERSTQWLLGFPWPSMRSPPEMPPRGEPRLPSLSAHRRPHTEQFVAQTRAACRSSSASCLNAPMRTCARRRLTASSSRCRC